MIKQRGNSWQVDLFREGKRHRKNFATEAEAQEYEARVLSYVADGASLDEVVQSATAPTSLRGFFEAHFEYLWGRSAHPHKVRQDAGVMFRHLNPDAHVRNIRDADIMEMVQKMYNAKLQGSTINRKLAVLSKLMKHAYRLQLITRVPVMDRQQEGVPRLWYLDETQERDLLDYLDKLKDTELLHITGFLLHTGARWGDLSRLKFKDWNEKDSTICFGKLKQGGWHIIPAMGHAKTALAWAKASWQRQHPDAELPDSARVFDVNYDTVRDRFQSALKCLGIYESGMGFHLLRHTCASRLVQRGVDLYVVQKWMAHKNIQTTQRYAKLHPRNLQSAADILTGKHAAE